MVEVAISLNEDLTGGGDDIRPPGEIWSCTGASNAQLAHPVVERRAVEAEARSSALWTSNHPIRLAQDTQDVLALHSFKRGGFSLIGGYFRCLLQFGERKSQGHDRARGSPLVRSDFAVL